MLTITGTIIKTFPEKHISPKFNTKEFVIETDDQYPQKVILTLINDKCDLLNQYSIGDEVKCHFNIHGREWLGHADGVARYYNTINVWKIVSANAE